MSFYFQNCLKPILIEEWTLVFIIVFTLVHRCFFLCLNKGKLITITTLSKSEEPAGDNDVGVSENGLYTPGGGTRGGSNTIENQLHLPGMFILVDDIKYATLFWYVWQRLYKEMQNSHDFFF